MKIIRLFLLLLAIISGPAEAADNQWILDHFDGLSVMTGAQHGQTVVAYPSMVRNSVCTAGWECFQVCILVWDTTNNTGYICDRTPNYADQRVAFVNVTVSNQVQNGKFGSGIITLGNVHGWNDMLDTFFSNVTISPYWPAFVNYQTTNLDGITFDAGHPGVPPVPGRGGHVYAEDLTVACPVPEGQPAAPCWADAALDVKPLNLQANRVHTEGSGINTLKLWQKGPHYIVNSTINNDRYVNTPQSGDDGGLVWTYDCAALVLNIYNSTFNGSPTLPRDRIGCQLHNGEPTVNYLNHDPTKTGEMHPMFGSTDETLAPGTSGSLPIIAPQVWTFSATDEDGGNYAILLNGIQAGTGRGNLLVNHNSQIYANTDGYGWFLWNGRAWVQSADPR